MRRYAPAALIVSLAVAGAWYWHHRARRSTPAAAAVATLIPYKRSSLVLGGANYELATPQPQTLSITELLARQDAGDFGPLVDVGGYPYHTLAVTPEESA